MKLACEIIQDLLPLMYDGVCSEESRNAISEHLETCTGCRKIAESMVVFCETELVREDKADDNVLHKGFRKIRRRWCLSAIAVVMIFPIILLGMMVNNERKGEGICFSSIDELSACEEYLDALKDKDYKAAAECVDFSEYFGEIEEALALRPNDYMGVYESVRIGEVDYMVNLGVLQRYLSEENFWSAVFRDCEEQAPIPKKVWEQISPEPSVRNGISYLPYETKWGTFMIVDTLFETLSALNEPALYDYFAIMPSDMYAELLPQMEQTAQTYYEKTQQRLSAVKGMDADAFADYMSSFYAEKIENDVQIESFDYRDAFYEDGRWNICYEAEVVWNGQNCRTRFEFTAKDGNILRLYAQNSERDEVMTRVLDSFSPRLG